MKSKVAEWLNVLFGFRKFLLMLFIMAVAVIFRLKDLINGTEMVDLIKNCAIAFIGANGVEHLVGAVQAHYAGKSGIAGPADTDESNDEEEVTTEPEPKD